MESSVKTTPFVPGPWPPPPPPPPAVTTSTQAPETSRWSDERPPPVPPPQALLPPPPPPPAQFVCVEMEPLGPELPCSGAWSPRMPTITVSVSPGVTGSVPCSDAPLPPHPPPPAPHSWTRSEVTPLGTVKYWHKPAFTEYCTEAEVAAHARPAGNVPEEVADVVGEPEGVGDRVLAAVAVGDGEAEVVALAVRVGAGDCVEDVVALAVSVIAAVAEAEIEDDGEAELVGEAEAEVVDEVEAEEELLSVEVGELDGELEADPLCVEVGEPVGEGEPERLGVGVGDALRDALVVAVGEVVAATEASKATSAALSERL